MSEVEDEKSRTEEGEKFSNSPYAQTYQSKEISPPPEMG